MENFDKRNHFRPNGSYLFFVKIILMFIFTGFVNMPVSAASGQNKRLSIEAKNISIKELLKKIEAETDYTFFYNTERIDVNQKVTAIFNDRPLQEVLTEVLYAKNIDYTIRDNQIVLSERNDRVVETSLQQSRPIEVSGSVTDNMGELLPGVTIIIRGTLQGTTTDVNGEYTIEVPSDTTVLQFSFVGYEPQEIKVGDRRVIAVSFSKATEMEEVVVVGFGKQKKTDLVGSVATVNVSELKKVSSSNVTTMLAGNIAGMISYQRSGEPGADNADFFIRGVTTFGYKKDPLILIDGIEVTSTELARMQPDDIANFSIMKDATSTAVYGARGANGVIAVTTKEGSEGKISISLRYENAFTSPTRDVEFADPVTYMKLANEAVLIRDPLGNRPYSRSKIDNTIAGTNRYVYPVTDWQNEMFKDFANSHRLNLNASGGGKVARYYLAATVNQDNGILKVDKRNNFNNNIKLNVYSFRSNINFDLTKSTQAALRISATLDDYTGPINGGTEVYNQVMHSNPVLFAPYYAPDQSNMGTNHILFGNYENANYINPYAEMVRGYKDYSKSKIDAQFEITQDLSAITEGLSVRGLFNTSRYSYFDVSRFYNPFYYNIGYYDRPSDTYTLAPLNETDGTEYLGYHEGLKEVSSSTYIELMSNYTRVFKEKHNISGMLVLIMRNSLTGNAGDLQRSLPHRNSGLSGRFTYSYKDKYYGEFNFGYNGSERFSKSHRFGFFPSAGLAWTISNEDFFKVEAVSNLKLRATFGLVGNDAIGSDADRFYYLSLVDMNSAARYARFGIPGSYYGLNGVNVNRNANADISWEIARKTNIGFELGLFNDKFTMEADYFHEYRSNILMERAYIPSTMGLTAVEKANVGEAKSQGIDGSLNYAASFGSNWWVKARANFTFATSEFIVYEEPDYKESYLHHRGNSISQTWGLIAERLFIDDADVANSPLQDFGEYGAGDIKYRDVNGDGKVTESDIVPIGYPTDPEIIYGFGVSAGYKNFDFSCFFQGSARSSFWINAAATSPFNDQTQLLKTYADSYWSEDYRDIYAMWPRLSPYINANNVPGAYRDGGGNWQWGTKNTWFMHDGAFLRLKSVELGYTLSSKLMNKLNITNARVYVNGTNLLCFSGFKLWDVEMGGNGLGYPIQKSINLGLVLSF